MVGVVNVDLAVHFSASAARTIAGTQGEYVDGAFGGVTIVAVEGARLDTTLPVAVGFVGGARLQARTRSTVMEGADVATLARCYWADGELVERTGVASVTGYLFDTARPAWRQHDALERRQIRVADAVSAGLQTGDSRWTYDGRGFNFEHVWPGAILRGGGRAYRIEYAIKRKTGESIVVAHDLSIAPAMSMRSGRFADGRSS